PRSARGYRRAIHDAQAFARASRCTTRLGHDFRTSRGSSAVARQLLWSSAMNQLTSLSPADLANVTGGGITRMFHAIGDKLGSAKESLKKSTADAVRGAIPSFPGRGQLGF